MLSRFSCVRLFATPWTVAHQAPLSMGFSRQEYWSGLPYPPPGDLLNPGIESRSPALQVDSLLSHQGNLRILEWAAYPFSRGILLRTLEWAAYPLSRGILLRTLKWAAYPFSRGILLRTLEWVAYPFSRGILLTQESNQGLLHCRQILYQLSYLESRFFYFNCS